MNTREQVPASVRLLTAGIASLLLLVWTLIGGGVPVIVPPGQSVSPWPVLITALLAAAILVILCPVVSRGRTGERLVSILLTIFPFLVFCMVLLWVAGVLQRAAAE